MSFENCCLHHFVDLCWQSIEWKIMRSYVTVRCILQICARDSVSVATSRLVGALRVPGICVEPLRLIAFLLVLVFLGLLRCPRAPEVVRYLLLNFYLPPEPVHLCLCVGVRRNGVAAIAVQIYHSVLRVQRVALAPS